MLTISELWYLVQDFHKSLIFNHLQERQNYRNARLKNRPQKHL